jgi:hypothetical protein
MAIRRYTIRPPQLVDRLSRPTPGGDPDLALRRVIAELDLVMAELQRFLRYLMDANDTAQTGQGIVGVDEDGEIHHPNVLSREDPGAHPATAITNQPAGGIVATNVQGAIDELDAEKSDFETVMMVADLGV